LQTAVWGYHVYQDIYTPTVGLEFDYQQEKEEDRYAVAVYGDSDSSDMLGHLAREILYVSYFFLVCGISITSIVTNRRRYCCPKVEWRFIQWKNTFGNFKELFQSHHFSCIEGIA